MFITGAEILVFVGQKNPSANDTEWSDACAAAVNGGLNTRLAGINVDDPSFALDELKVAARIAGGECYKRREATFGLTGYADMEGAAIRVAKDYLAGVDPIIARYVLPGVG